MDATIVRTLRSILTKASQLDGPLAKPAKLAIAASVVAAAQGITKEGPRRILINAANLL